MESNRP